MTKAQQEFERGMVVRMPNGRRGTVTHLTTLNGDDYAVLVSTEPNALTLENPRTTRYFRFELTAVSYPPKEHAPMAVNNRYIILPSLAVLVATSKAATKAAFAEAGEGAILVEGDSLTDVPTSTLLALYNKAAEPDKQVVKFKDRATAERRMSGVLEFLAKPVAGTPSEPKATKVKGERAPKVNDISPEVVQDVIARRKRGEGWPAILAAYGKTTSFIIRIRPFMKAVDPTLVKPLGPGSPNYGKGKAPKAPKAPKASGAATMDKF